jgi:hypothetical protein
MLKAERLPLAQTEELVFDAIDRLIEGKTAVVIAPVRANGAAGHDARASRMVEGKTALRPLVTG